MKILVSGYFQNPTPEPLGEERALLLSDNTLPMLFTAMLVEADEGGWSGLCHDFFGVAVLGDIELDLNKGELSFNKSYVKSLEDGVVSRSPIIVHYQLRRQDDDTWTGRYIHPSLGVWSTSCLVNVVPESFILLS